MIITKHREDSKLLKGLRYLDKRSHLKQEDRKRLINMEKGIKGEEIFDLLVKKHLNSEVLVLHDLLLIHSGSTFQIDTVIISSTKVFLYEVKYYQGDFTNNNGQLMTASGKEINHPSTQLKRTETLMRKLLQDKECEFEVEGYVAFTHPSFYLYQSVSKDPFIFMPQFEKHFRSVSSQSNNLKDDHHYLSDTLIQLQREEAPYQKQLPDYSYDELKKGLNCSQCVNLNLTLTQRTTCCRDCGHSEGLATTVRNNVRQYFFLFPDKRLTSAILFEWVGGQVSQIRLSRILNKDYLKIGCSKGTYYMEQTRQLTGTELTPSVSEV